MADRVIGRDFMPKTMLDDALHHSIFVKAALAPDGEFAAVVAHYRRLATILKVILPDKVKK